MALEGMAERLLTSRELVMHVACFLEFDSVAALSVSSRSVRCPAQAALVGRGADVYVFGGCLGLSASSSTSRLRVPSRCEQDEGGRGGCHTSCGSWEVLAPMSQPRVGAVAAAIRGLLYVCGGWGGDLNDPLLASGCNLGSAERFHPLENRWEALPDMQEFRRIAAGAALGGCLYVCGGEGGCNGEFVLSSTERFDPVAHRWELLPSMAGHRFGAASAALRGGGDGGGGVGSGRLVVLGGSLGVDALCSAELYCPQRGCWEELPDMIEPRCGAAAVAISGGGLLVCGGGRAERTLYSAELLRPGQATWEVATFVPRCSFRFAACTPVGEGRLVVCGGQLGCASGLTDARRLDPGRSAWEALAPLVAPLALAAGARLLC